MDYSFEEGLSEPYKSPSQKIRVMSEYWVRTQLYCPNCGHEKLEPYPNNNPAADFFCLVCSEDYELKSQKNRICPKLMDGAYGTMLSKLRARTNPNLFSLIYDFQSLSVSNVFVVPKHFFVPDIIEKRKPLGPLARRAGWIGCNILIDRVPQAGRIFLIRDRITLPKIDVLGKWQKTLFLRNQQNIEAKGWLLSVLRCVERLQVRTFTLNDVYAFEDELRASYPGNRHVRAKIRQKLQVLRDRGFLEFIGNGTYRMIPTDSQA